MTELSHLKAHAELQLGSNAPFATPLQPPSNGYSPPEENLDDEAIKCICGFNEDDGNTVFCEVCHTWGHIECYYPDGVVPEVHECLDCKPRAIDVESAKERQRSARVVTSSSERKAKRPPAKNSKKRAKEANGWLAPDPYYATDRTSGSPRDQPPPSKRPKTTHRSSASISRKRAGSSLNVHSPTKNLRSPPARPYSGDYFSQEYMTLHEKPEFTPIQTNVLSHIAVSNDLSSWLNDPERLREVTGKTQHEIFQRWDRNYEELECTSPGVAVHTKKDTSITIRDRHPVIKSLTLNSLTPAGAYIGELKGAIGRKDEYQQDPANRWDELRHPEPFVFFHDALPVYIDSRIEGTKLRYVRRSCFPNVKMQIIINNGEYHFCLVSTEVIQAGEEITLGWSLDARFYNTMMLMSTNRNNIDEDDEAYVINWVSCVLANFGGCACGRPLGGCLMTRFDARDHPHSILTNGHGLKPPKARKTKKSGTQISPLSTGRATNSRAASEAINATDPDDDNIDARSSSRSKPTSRDITPMTATNDGSVDLGVEISNRERRKLLHQEKFFQQLEHAEHAPKKGKKRNSAGSTVNTPSASVSWNLRKCYLKRLLTGYKKLIGYPDSGAPSPLPSAGRPRLNGPTMSSGLSTSSRRHNSNGTLPGQRRAKPIYTNASTQTDKESEEPPSELTLLRRKRGSNLLLLSLRKRQAERERHPLSVEEQANMASRQSSRVSSPVLGKDAIMTDKEASAAMPPPPVPSSPDSHRAEPSVAASSPATSIAEEKPDVEMKDVGVDAKTETSPVPNSETVSTSTRPEASLPQTNGNVQPPAPPSVAPSTNILSFISSKAHDLHVQLPSAPTFPVSLQTPTTPSVGTTTPGSITGSALTESPLSTAATTAPVFSPAVTSAVAPSPMKKRISLSDYTNRRKRNEALAQQAQNNSSNNNQQQQQQAPTATAVTAATTAATAAVAAAAAAAPPSAASTSPSTAAPADDKEKDKDVNAAFSVLDKADAAPPHAPAATEGLPPEAKTAEPS